MYSVRSSAVVIQSGGNENLDPFLKTVWYLCRIVDTAAFDSTKLFGSIDQIQFFGVEINS